MTNEPIGLLFVGCLGMTASATIAGIRAFQQGAVAERYGASSDSAFAGINFVGVDNLYLGGWDTTKTPIAEVLANYAHLPSAVIANDVRLDVPQFSAVMTRLDYADGGLSYIREPASVSEGVSWIARDIEHFRKLTGVAKVIVVYVGSPSKTPSRELMTASRVPDSSASVPSSLLYALGAARAGADFIDFTPSFALEFACLAAEAHESGISYSGRDGSTGQTMLKTHLMALFDMRGLDVRAWYSTNVLGNRDGLALTRPGYGDAKIADKTGSINLPLERHKVTIDYVEHWGDRKEAWDAIELSTWLGGELSVRIDWRGSDSELAAPMLLDVVRFLSARKHQPGFQPQLGFFFKRPFGRESTTLDQRWQELVGFYAS